VLELQPVSSLYSALCGGLSANPFNAVFSGARAFSLLTPEEQEFALNTTVTYAPQAYEYIRQCKASDDGLTIPTMGNEVSVEKLSEWSWDKVAEHPVSLTFDGIRPFTDLGLDGLA
jgi:hypothetical protein